MACAAGEWDMCRNGQYTERGIKERNGYAAERFRIEPEFAVKVPPELGTLGVLLEPASIVAKGWDHLDRIGRRSRSWQARTVLVTGAGPIGLLAALMGVQRGLEVHMLDRNTQGPKFDLARELGVIYHTEGPSLLDEWQPDILFECTGAVPVIAAVLGRTAPSGIICLAGVTGPGHKAELGTVNANRSHYESAADALARADRNWLRRMITRQVPMERWHEALEHQRDDIKVIIDFSA
jgi:threonine dehydrogenase-like Zn-dependent dehydrogenase